MKRHLKNTIQGAFLAGIAFLCGMHAQEAQAARNDNNPIVFSAVARDADGFVQRETELSVDCRLVDRSSREIVYRESHRLTTDAMGQLQIPIGDGTAANGNFADVDFSTSLDLEIYDDSRLMTRAPLSQVPAAAFADKAETARTAQVALTAETARTAQTAIRAQSAQALDGIAFNDNAEPDQATIWSSAKVARLIGGQTGQPGQTALAKEKAERIAEDLRLWDSIAAHHQRLNDLGDSLTGLEIRINDSIVIVRDSLHALREALRQMQEDLEAQIDEINFCLVNDARKGLYTVSIPLYDHDYPQEVGLFTNPLLKILKQNGNQDLISALDQAGQLRHSYRTRVMTYNMDGTADSPKEVYIPASTDGLEIYVDNYRIDVPVTYYTYDALVFDVEFYHLGDGLKPKLYITLIRE